MAQSEISKPIHVILDGDNYSLWAKGMCSFLKCHKLWFYVTGQRHPPKQQKDETEDVFALHFSTRRLGWYQSSDHHLALQHLHSFC